MGPTSTPHSAAVTLGAQAHLVASGEPAALILGALVTIGVASAAALLTARKGAGHKPAVPGPAEPPG